MTKIEFPQIVIRSGWYGVCPGDCYCSLRPPLTDDNKEYPQGGQYWEVQVLYEGSPVANLKYKDTWCPLYMDYVVLTGMPVDDDGIHLTLKFNTSMEGAIGGPQLLFPVFAQLFYSRKERRWKMGVVKEYNVICERAQPPCCLPRRDVKWGIDEAAISEYGYVEIVKGDDPTEVQLHIMFTEPEEDWLECKCENFYFAFPYGCPPFHSCTSASFSKHPDWVSWNYFGAFTNLSTKSCWNSQIYKINVRTGQGSVDTISNELRISGEPILPKQCWPWIPIGLGTALGIGFILSRFGGD